MRIAQQLYEGVDIKGSGTVGLITYLRTDSTRISEEADANARAYVGKAYGEEYVAETASEQKQKNDGKNIQDAHEAIRPSDVTRVPAEIKESLTECSRQNMRQLLLKLEQMITVLRYRHLRLYLKVSVWHMWKAMRKNRVEM